jgi:hypothetical protein
MPALLTVVSLLDNWIGGGGGDLSLLVDITSLDIVTFSNTHGRDVFVVDWEERWAGVQNGRQHPWTIRGYR